MPDNSDVPDGKETIQVRATETIAKGKTVFNFNLPTPMWVTWFFRVEFIINKCLMMYWSGTTRDIDNLKETIFTLAVIDFGVWLLAKSIGIKKADLGFDETT